MEATLAIKEKVGEEVGLATHYEEERGKPRPSKNHAIVQHRLGVRLSHYEDRLTILPELSLELGGKPMVPDISVYPKLDIDWYNDEVQLTDPPQLVIEILSPRQPLDDLVRKAQAYLAAGVKSCWIVQPVLRSIVVLRPDEKPITHSDAVNDPTTGIEISVDKLFG